MASRGRRILAGSDEFGFGNKTRGVAWFFCFFPSIFFSGTFFSEKWELNPESGNVYFRQKGLKLQLVKRFNKNIELKWIFKTKWSWVGMVAEWLNHFEMISSLNRAQPSPVVKAIIVLWISIISRHGCRWQLISWGYLKLVTLHSKSCLGTVVLCHITRLIAAPILTINCCILL